MVSTDQSFIENIRHRCCQQPGVLALPESEDPRIVRAAFELLQEQSFRQVVFFTERTKLRALAQSLSFRLEDFPEQIIFAKEAYPNLEQDVYHHLDDSLRNRGKDVVKDDLRRNAQSALLQAGELLYQNKVDVALAGAICPTAQVIRAALSTVGLEKNHRTVSGSFIMNRLGEAPLVFGDCGVVIHPKPHQLADIASQCADTLTRLTDQEAKVAFLSFSTMGSAADSSIDAIQEALALLRTKRPHLLCEGEMQFDAAYVPEVAARKLKESRVGGQANVFIFPDLNSGNIGYKIAQRLGGFSAYGPILQGLNRPYSDLSRGCSVEEIKVSAYINLQRHTKNADT